MRAARSSVVIVVIVERVARGQEERRRGLGEVGLLEVRRESGAGSHKHGRPVSKCRVRGRNRPFED